MVDILVDIVSQRLPSAIYKCFDCIRSCRHLRLVGPEAELAPRSGLCQSMTNKADL